MISSSSKRPMPANEKRFSDQVNKMFLQFAIEVNHPSELQPFLEKIINSTAGLFVKTDGFNLLRNNVTKDSVKVHKIPKSIKTLQGCCDWLYNNLTPNNDHALASIAADETRVVVNSNHALTDGGYYAQLLQDIQDPNADNLFKNVAPIPGDLRNDLLKNEFDQFLKDKAKYAHNWPSFKNSDLTFLNLQECVDLPDRSKLVPPRLQTEMKCNELSPFIFDRKTGKTNHMSDYLWLGICLSMNAKNGKFGSIGVDTCMDFRRILPKSKINHSFGNAFTNFTLCVENPNPKMTIGDICKQFRKNFNLIRANDWFYKEYLFPLEVFRENCSVCHVSNVGKLSIKDPLKDFYLQVTSKENALRPFAQVTSYCKGKVETGLNDFILHFRYSPVIMSYKTAKDIFDTYVYFLKNVDPSKKSGDVLDELIHFQQSLN